MAGVYFITKFHFIARFHFMLWFYFLARFHFMTGERGEGGRGVLPGESTYKLRGGQFYSQS